MPVSLVQLTSRSESFVEAINWYPPARQFLSEEQDPSLQSPELCLNHWATPPCTKMYTGMEQSHPCCVVCWLVFLTQKISATNPSTIKASNFRTHRKTRFIIHGHLVGADFPWITNICRVWYDYRLTVILLVLESANIHITLSTGLKFPHKMYTSVLLFNPGNIWGEKNSEWSSVAHDHPLVPSYEYSALQPFAKCPFAAFTSTGKAIVDFSMSC